MGSIARSILWAAWLTAIPYFAGLGAYTFVAYFLQPVAFVEFDFFRTGAVVAALFRGFRYTCDARTRPGEYVFVALGTPLNPLMFTFVYSIPLFVIDAIVDIPSILILTLAVFFACIHMTLDSEDDYWRRKRKDVPRENEVSIPDEFLDSDN